MEAEEIVLIATRDILVFPGITTVVSLSRQDGIGALSNSIDAKTKVCFALQRPLDPEQSNDKAVFNVGVICEVIKKISDNNFEIKLFVKALNRVEIKSTRFDKEITYCTVKKINKQTSKKEDVEEVEKLKKLILNKAESILKAKSNVPFEIIEAFKISANYNNLVFILSSILNIEPTGKQKILEAKTELEGLKKLYEYIEIETNLLETEKTLNGKIDKKLQESQKQYYLKEKIKLYKKELDDSDNDEDDNTDIQDLKKKAKDLNLSEEARNKFDNEIKKLSDVPTYSPDYSTILNHLQWLTDLPWNDEKIEQNDIKKAKEILDNDHYGLDDVKERIIEFIAVYSKTKKLNGSIICFVGAPGVGKTSMAKSIAKALNRKYTKISLGGVRDEAEIRGHRKTYVGAMPGKIIQSMKKVGTKAPLILLDEIDKMSFDSNRGDPASALLEVLDPEQNKSFNDHFLEVEYDLSNVIFIATANSLANIPEPLKDRMEIIHISGYTEDEKLEIAKRYIIPKELEKHGITENEFTIEDSAIIEIIRRYTFEAGVRNLERCIETLIRKTTTKIVEDDMITMINIDCSNIKDFLGVEKFDYNKANKEPQIGVANGLAYTEYGGDILYIEALKFNGTGKLLSTGKLGDVMKESIEAGFSYVRSKAENFGINAETFNKYDFHLHVPEGATPKDGPSARIAVSTALMSALTGLKIRNDFAMTGEITLTGKVLPIGGLKEKLLGALRGGIKKVIIPFDNVKDLEKIPEKVKTQMKILPVKTVDEAFKLLLIDYK